MFNKKQAADFSKFDTLIGKNTAFEGILEATGTIRIDGQIKGDVKVDGDIYIGEESKIIGNITGSTIVVSGRVDGNIMAKEQLRLTSTGKVLGDISVQSLIIDENGVFEGNSTMVSKEIRTESKIKEVNKNEVSA